MIRVLEMSNDYEFGVYLYTGNSLHNWETFKGCNGWIYFRQIVHNRPSYLQI